MTGMVNIVVALQAEAVPLIDHFDLKLVKSAPFKHYEGENITLVISGLGSDLAAAACGYLYGLDPKAPAGWLNVGIGGHGKLPIGALRLAEKVADHRAGLEFPMRLAGLPDIQTSKITTYYQVEPRYPENTICDMESVGFVSACRALTGPRGIAVLKVVSDNEENPVEKVTPALATQILEAKLVEIESVVTALLNLNEKETP